LPSPGQSRPKIGLRLRAVRTAEGFTLQILAGMTGGVLSKSRVSKYEQGLRRLGIEEAGLLSTALGNVSVTYLSCLDDVMT
jgi:transcriptional regulator with XRE-family HTH domain